MKKKPQPHPHARTIAQNLTANERSSREKGKKKDCSNQQKKARTKQPANRAISRTAKTIVVRGE